MKRNLISLQDFTQKEIQGLLLKAVELKADRSSDRTALAGKVLGLLFQKPSNRTRVSFEVGVHQLGGQAIYLGPEEINLGKRESTADVAATLSRYLDGVIARTFRHEDIVELGRVATIPVINGLSDLYHPCQALADLMSVQENFKTCSGLTLAYIGDGNNVCHSLMFGCVKVGMNIRVATPPGYEPRADVVALAQSEAAKNHVRIHLTHAPQDAVDGAQVVYTDVWTSMGQEAEQNERRNIFRDFQVNEALCRYADKNFIFMHCLPAHRGEEVTAEVIDGPHSIVFDQAENRLHVQKAVLLFLMQP